jgi:hypothetical protein
MRKVILMLGVLACSVSASSASTILQFTELTFNTPFHVTTNGTTSTISAVNVPVNVIFDPGFCLNVGCNGATNGTYLFNLNATSTGNRQLVNGGNDLNQPFGGTLSFTNGGINLLTVNFTDEFAGSLNGSTPTLAASQPPDVFSGSSNVLDPLKLGVPRGFALSFSNFNPGVGSNGTTLNAANADGAGTFNASPVVQNPVPEPGSMLLFGTGLIGAAIMARRRKK